MYDAGKIVVGIAAFLGFATFPVWYTLASGSNPPPTLAKPAKGERCVEDKTWMRANHMELLNEWRDSVVRQHTRSYSSRDHAGDVHDMSLTRTCLDCHDDKVQFCDRCHGYLSVSPSCWDCHNDPKVRPNG
jgi:hypothetical protein